MKHLLEKFSTHASLYAAIAAAGIANKQNSFLSPYKPMLGDLLKSSSVLLSLPFSRGDKVSINTEHGEVKGISMRYVTLENKEYFSYVPTHVLYGAVIRKYK